MKSNLINILITVLLFFLILSLSASSNNKKRTTIALKRHDLRGNGYSRQYEISNELFLTSTSTTHSIKLINSLDRIYTGSIMIGSPEQQSFNVVFDTGSADLWIFSSYSTCTVKTTCHDYDCSNESCCFYKNIMSSYDHGMSTTYKRFSSKSSSNDWSIQYGKGSSSGQLALDTVSIGNLNVSDQVFAEAKSWSNDLISCSEPMDGILGLAMKQASEDKASTLIENLYTQGQISAKIFSITLQLKNNNEYSYLILGDPDPLYYTNDIIYGNVIQPTTYGMWWTQIMGIIYNDMDNNFTSKNINWLDTCPDTNPCIALVDTGTSYITMPSSTYNKFISYLQLKVESCRTVSGQFECPHSQINDLPILYFQFGGKALPLYPSEYMLSDSCSSDSYDCLAITTLDSMGSHAYILGDSFLRNYYAVFDEENYRVGFGSLNTFYNAIDRPDSDDSLWYYVKIVALIIAGVGILVCILFACCKHRRQIDHNDQSLSDFIFRRNNNNTKISSEDPLLIKDNNNNNNIINIINMNTATIPSNVSVNNYNQSHLYWTNNDSYEQLE